MLILSTGCGLPDKLCDWSFDCYFGTMALSIFVLLQKVPIGRVGLPAFTFVSLSCHVARRRNLWVAMEYRKLLFPIFRLLSRRRRWISTGPDKYFSVGPVGNLLFQRSSRYGAHHLVAIVVPLHHCWNHSVKLRAP